MKPILLLSALVALAVAGYWDIEKVDSAGWGVGVQVRQHPDGRVFLCYSNALGAVRLAWSDSVWHRDSVPVGIGLNLFGVGEQTFELGSHGELMVACADSFGHILCAERLGQTWFVDSIGGPGAYGMACLALDSSGAPALIYGTMGARNAYLFRVARRESVWVRDTIDFFESAYPNVFYASGGTNTHGSLFKSADMIEASWAVIEPMLQAWRENPDGLAFYPAGSEGPAAADDLLKDDGRHWRPLV